MDNETVKNNAIESITMDLQEIGFINEEFSKIKRGLYSNPTLSDIVKLHEELQNTTIASLIDFVKSYQNTNKTGLIQILELMISKRVINIFGKGKYDLHISDFKKHYSDDKIKTFLQDNGIDEYIDHLKTVHANHTLENLKQKTVQLYLLFTGIPDQDWDFTENKPKKTVDIYQRFERKNLVLNISRNTLGQLYFKIRIPDNPIFQKMCEMSGFLYYHITHFTICMADNAYELQTCSKTIPLTDELIDFFLSLVK